MALRVSGRVALLLRVLLRLAKPGASSPWVRPCSVAEAFQRLVLFVAVWMGDRSVTQELLVSATTLSVVELSVGVRLIPRSVA